MTVGFMTAAGLVNQLVGARDEKRLLKLQASLSKLQLLIVHELGYMPLSPTGIELLFEVFSQRYPSPPRTAFPGHTEMPIVYYQSG